MSRAVLILGLQTVRKRAADWCLKAPAGTIVEFKESKRSTEQNSRMWAMLGKVSEQVDWYGRKLTPEAWKAVFSASLKKQDVVPGLHGDFVVIGQSTSQMTVAEMTELMDLMEAFGVEKGVQFTEVAA